MRRSRKKNKTDVRDHEFNADRQQSDNWEALCLYVLHSCRCRKILMHQNFAWRELEVGRYWYHTVLLAFLCWRDGVFFLYILCRLKVPWIPVQFFKCMLSTYYVPSIMLDSKVTEINKILLGFKKPLVWPISCSFSFLHPYPVSFRIASDRKYMNHLFLL